MIKNDKAEIRLLCDSICHEAYYLYQIANQISDNWDDLNPTIGTIYHQLTKLKQYTQESIMIDKQSQELQILLARDNYISVVINGDAGVVDSNLHYINSDLSSPINDYNFAIDIVESIVLAHAMAGINVESVSYTEGLQTTIDTLAQRYL